MKTASSKMNTTVGRNSEGASPAPAVHDSIVSVGLDLTPGITEREGRKVYAAGLWSLLGSYARNPANAVTDHPESRLDVISASLWYDGCEVEPAQKSTLKGRQTRSSTEPVTG
jgi:hypothetical protein